MAFYTPPAQLNLPRSPNACFPMNAALPSIRPADFLAWSSWPLTPPLTSTFQSKSTQRPPTIHKPHPSTVLPPIAQLERQIPPLTPPEDEPFPSLPKIATIPSDADFFQHSPIAQPQIPPQSSHTPPSPTHLHVPSAMDTSLPPPEITPNTCAAAASTINTLALATAPSSYMVDWLDFTRTRSAHFIAEKTCEMICYLWFSIPSHARVAPENKESAVSEPTVDPKTKNTSSVSSLQLIATPAFVSFMQKLLETTQVSQSVIVLSLHYIHRLKEKNAYTPAQSGSEFRIAVTGLMMANKFLDDNTYTNKTWSEVSGISMDEINRMEREFLLGVDFNLYVDKTTYASWLNLLKGLVLAKERDARRLQRGSGTRVSSSARRGIASGREARFWHPHNPAHPKFGSTGPASRTYTTTAAHGTGVDLFSTRRQSAHPAVGEEPVRSYRHRARSTSPRSFPFSGRSIEVPRVQEQQYTLNIPPDEPQQEEQPAYNHQYYQPVQPTVSPIDHAYLSSPTPTRNMPVSELTTSTGTKRSAADAFASPPSSAFIPPQARLRRPASLYGRLHTLQIPEFPSASSASASSVASSMGRLTSTTNPSPLDGLGGFERMCLDGEERAREQREAVVEERRQAKRARADAPVATVIPQTLMAAYSADEAKRAALPKNLFFYTLASSPSSDEKELERERLRQIRAQSASSDAMRIDAEPGPYFEPRARKAKLRCQAAQPVKYGYNNYADLNAFASSTRYAPLYSYHEPSSQQTYVSTSGTSTARHVPHAAAVPSHSESRRPSLVMPSPFPNSAGHPVPPVVQSASASPATCALPHFRDDVWARTPMPAQALQQQTRAPCEQSPSVCLSGPGTTASSKWFEGGRQKEEQQLTDYSDSPAVQTAAAHGSSHRYASAATTNVASTSSSSSHPGSASSSPYYQQQQQQQQQQHQNIRRQIMQDVVPSAPFANAGPPGVGVQFYATPEVQRVQVPVSVQVPGVYNNNNQTNGSYSTTYSSSSVNGSAAAAAALNHLYSGQAGSATTTTTYTYSGAHSTSNSPYHSAASGPFRYGDYGYSSQTAVSGYGRY